MTCACTAGPTASEVRRVGVRATAHTYFIGIVLLYRDNMTAKGIIRKIKECSFPLAAIIRMELRKTHEIPFGCQSGQAATAQWFL